MPPPPLRRHHALLDRDGTRTIPLPGLYDGLHSLKVDAEFAGWHVVPSKERGRCRNYRVEAVAGLNPLVPAMDVDLAKDAPGEVVVKLPPVFQPGELGLAAGNTHLHLMKLTKDDAEEYLRQIPSAAATPVLFISYLERFKDDAEYITNRYPVGDLPACSMPPASWSTTARSIAITSAATARATGA